MRFRARQPRAMPDAYRSGPIRTHLQEQETGRPAVIRSQMEFDEILYEVNDRVATIKLNRPEKMNAWTPVMETELRAAIDVAGNDNGVRSIVITGSGRAFCAGADMNRLNAASQASAEARERPASSDTDLEQRFSYLLAVPKPLIAGINGAVAGVAVCITLYCDIRYMAAGAKLTTPYSRRGLIAEHGSAWLLPRLIGPMHAADLLLSGRIVEASEAAAMGLVNMLPAEDFHQAVHARAAELANLCSPRSIRIIKQQLLLAGQQSLAQATRLADEELDKCRGTEDFREGVAHFIEKRTPNFEGT
jgi:enoyl-CoA hydratase/carnithine racemase